MAETAVVNASPVIFLSRAGLIDLLQLISAEVIVPESVAQKLRFEVSRDPAPQSLANTSWVVVTQYLQSQLKSKPWD